MFDITEIGPRSLELTLKGLVTKTDVEAFEKALAPLLDGDGPIGFVIRPDALSDMTADAIVEDATYEMSLLPRLARFRRIAIVTEKQAWTALARMVDPYLPMIEIRAFAPSDIEAARAFACDLDTTPSGIEDGVRVLETDRPTLFA